MNISASTGLCEAVYFQSLKPEINHPLRSQSHRLSERNNTKLCCNLAIGQYIMVSEQRTFLNYNDKQFLIFYTARSSFKYNLLESVFTKRGFIYSLNLFE